MAVEVIAFSNNDLYNKVNFMTKNNRILHDGNIAIIENSMNITRRTSPVAHVLGVIRRACSSF